LTPESNLKINQTNLLATIKPSLQHKPAVQTNNDVTPQANLPGKQKKNVKPTSWQELNA
jgi:translation initiation factor IF-1